MQSRVHAFEWISDNSDDLSQGCLRIIDQLKLPNELAYRDLRKLEDCAQAIERMEVRGAPAIGIVAAFGLAFATKAHGESKDFTSLIEAARARLAKTRPTAVNLFWALDRMMALIEKTTASERVQRAFEEAFAIWDEDIEMNLAMAEHGANAMGNISQVLTHCNAGALATGGLGTALGVIRALDERAKARGKRLHVWVDETRPYLQGARLTAWELLEDNIDATLITDNMAGYFMQNGLVEAVIIGADRIATNGDVANKIGSYSLAVLAKFHKIPFYVAAPKSTFDPKANSLQDIPIEERSAEEVTVIAGKHIAPEKIKVRHPAFDLCPNELITAIITEEAAFYPPFDFSVKDAD